jgi:hypothetical protein
MRGAGALACFVIGVHAAGAAELKPQTNKAFDRYVSQKETAIGQRLQPGNTFLWVDDKPERSSHARAGQILIENGAGQGPVAIPGGLIHDWVGAMFVPGVTLEKTLLLIQDYNRNKYIYKPEVLDSRLISRHGNDFKVYLRLLKKEVITVVLDTYYDVRYYPLDASRCYSRSYSTRISEVENPGKPDERDLPPGRDHGFLWRLYTYWRFEQRDGGVYFECEAVSLTRGIPGGLGWLIEPIIQDLPRESLASTLREARAALVK